MRGEPVRQALHGGQAAVQRHQAAAGETLSEPRLELGREVDLGYQHQRLPSGRQGRFGGAQVDLGLAAAGHAVQQLALRLDLAGTLRRQHRQHRRLLGGQVRPRWRDGWLGGGRLGRRAGWATRAARGRWFGLGQAPGPVQPTQPFDQAGVIKLAQLRGQYCQRHLADRTLVVAGREVHQGTPGRGQRRQRGHHLLHRAQTQALWRRPRRGRPDQARHAAVPQRHTHQCASRKFMLTLVIEQVGHARMLRCLDSHTNLYQCASSPVAWPGVDPVEFRTL